MARVQFVISDDDPAQFGRQARQEGLSLSAWLRAAAHDRLGRKSRAERCAARADLTAFFAECDALPGPPVEPDRE